MPEQRFGLRAYFEGLGNNVSWNPDSAKVTIAGIDIDTSGMINVEGRFEATADQIRRIKEQIAAALQKNRSGMNFGDNDKIDGNVLKIQKADSFDVSQKKFVEYDDVLPRLKQQGVNSHHNINNFEEMNQFRLGGVHDFYESGHAFMFMTTPDLNISGVDRISKENLEADSFFLEVSKNQKYLLKCVASSAENSSPFINIITNRFKSFETRDVALRTKQIAETFYGYKMLMPSSMVESIIADQFTITYLEDSYLSITKIHKLWTDYTEYVRRGKFLPSLYNIENGFIDYMSSSVYYFSLKPDGRTITYFTKYTGVAPVAVPYNVFAFRLGEFNANVELTIPYVFCHKEDLNPDILADFNYVSAKAGSPVYIEAVQRKVPGSSEPKVEYVLEFANNPFKKII